MDWIFIGTLLGSLITSQHPTKEACEGQRSAMTVKSVYGQCIKLDAISNFIVNGTTTTIGVPAKLCTSFDIQGNCK